MTEIRNARDVNRVLRTELGRFDHLPEMRLDCDDLHAHVGRLLRANASQARIVSAIRAYAEDASRGYLALRHLDRLRERCTSRGTPPPPMPSAECGDTDSLSNRPLHQRRTAATDRIYRQVNALTRELSSW